MIARLALLFTVVTLVELTILIPVGQAIGTLPTIALVLGTAILGATLAKRQGLAIWQRIQRELASGELPGESLLDGLAVVIAGAFLLTPGVLTDIAGIALLIPPVRAPLKMWLKSHAGDMLDHSSVTYVQGQPMDNPYGDPFGGGANRPRNEDGDVIDVTPTERDNQDNEDSNDPIELPASG